MAARASRGPIEAAAGEHLVPELSRLIDRALAQSLPEDLVHSLVEHHVPERIAAELARTGALDRLVEQALPSPRTSELVDRIVQSNEMKRAIRELAASPEVREAVAQQTTGLAEELVVEVCGWARRLDARLDRRHAVATPYAGVATRAIAFTLDLLLIVVLYTLVSGFVALISSLVGTLRPAWLVGTLLGIGWTLVAGVYLVFFWSACRPHAGNAPAPRARPRGFGQASVGRPRDRPRARHLDLDRPVLRRLSAGALRRAGGAACPTYLAGTEVVYSDRDG